MKLNTNDLLEGFYPIVKHQYPDLTEQEIKDIVLTPFKMVKEDMENGEMSTCRLKYLGTFLVWPRHAKACLDRLTKRWKELKVDNKEYFELKKKIEDYVNKEK